MTTAPRPEVPDDLVRAIGAGQCVAFVGAGCSAAAVPSWARIAERLLMEMRAQDLRAPVIVFASGGHAEENRRTALNMGAQAYTFEWPTLFREIERVLRPVGADS